MTTGPRPADSATARRRIAGALAEIARDHSGVDTAPHPYLRRHLAGHAHAADSLDDTHLPPNFLPWETSGHVRGLLGLPIRPGPEKAQLAAWAAVEPFLADADPPSRRLSLAFAVTTQGTTSHDTEDPAATSQGASGMLAPRWAHWRLPSNVLATTNGPVYALTAFPGPDGRTLLATSSVDETVRLWDPATGGQVGHPLTGHTGSVTAVTAVTAEGRTLLATASVDETVRLWDPATGSQVGHAVTSRGRGGQAGPPTTRLTGAALAGRRDDVAHLR